ncbi:pirin family protein [Streptomyces thermogriseus]|uniref:Pirin family protein n=1 Tax=Streptomyces thermogriseus TaxID=75292 RepID=A0ABN1SZY4_9ACTN
MDTVVCGAALVGFGFGHGDKPASSGCVRVPPGRHWGLLGASGPGATVVRVTTEVRRAAERYRGGDAAAGITSWHAFSFGPHYDPDNLRFGALIACNEERLAPGAGFDEHPHSHTEIVTWVVEGELTHRDSTGHETVVRPGDLQHLSAADGVRHVERNGTGAPVTFVQMWLTPLRPGGAPRYELVRGVGDSAPYDVPEAGARLHVRRPAAGERTAVPDAAYVYIHVVRGEVRLGEDRLGPGDAARITGAQGLEAVGVTAAELLMWEMRAG